MVHTLRRHVAPRLAGMLVFAMIAMAFPFLHTLAVGEYLLLSVWSGVPGSSVSVQGNGFPAGASVTVTFQGLQKTATADASGVFTTDLFTVPSRPGGSYPVNATSATASATAQFYIEGFFPAISPTEWWAAPGQAVGLNAQHFAPGETLRVFLAGSATPVATFAADAQGNAHATNLFQAPASSAGKSLTITVTGADSGATASIAIEIGGFFAFASPSTYYATPGQIVGVSGGGFAPGETLNLMEGSTKVGSFTANGQGTFDIVDALRIAFGSTGSRTLHVVGESSGASSGEFSIAIGGLFPEATPTEYFALPGNVIGVTASGFAPDETVRLEDSKGAFIASAPADSKGKVTGLQTAITIPYGATGNLTYRLVGDLSAASTTFGFSVGGFDPQLDPSTWYTAPLKTMQGIGRGFAPNEPVAISINGTVVTNVTADAHGNFTASFKAPKSGENFLLKATGGNSGGVAERTIGMNTECIVED